jgi:hypothetical protein
MKSWFDWGGISPAVFTLAVLLLGTEVSPAQVPSNPLAPNLAMPAPMGMQRGTSLELILTGTNLADPTALWTSFPAKVTIPTDNNNGKDNAKLRVRLEVAQGAPLGFHALRLATRHGMSNLRLFCVDDLPQVMKVDSNRSKTTAQQVPVPCVVAGRADAEVSDYFKINVKTGQRVSFEILGRRLGSAFDPQLSLVDPRTQRELAYSNDAPGLQTDARMTYTFKEAGDYLLEVRDVQWRGGADFWYRLRIGDFPCATTPVPMAAKRGSKVTVQFAGPNVAGVAPVEVAVPADPAAEVVWVAPRGSNGLHGWPVALAVSDLEEVVEQEPNNEPAKANRISVPGGVTGRFQEKGDIDQFVFAAKKGQHWIIHAHTHEWYSPTEVLMVLKNAMGMQVAASNPAADPRIDFTVPTDGDYFLTVEHLLYWGGPNETYRVTITPFKPGFDLTLGSDRVDMPRGGVGVVPIQTVARRNYNGPIEVSVDGPPGIKGQAVLQPGPVVPNQPAGLLFITADPGLALGPLTLGIRGQATISGKMVTVRASARPVVSQALANLPYPPRQLFPQVLAAVTDQPPFTLAITFAAPEQIRGGPAALTVTATRAAGFTEEIALTLLGLPANVAPALKNIPKEQNEVKAQVTPAANAALGQFTVSVSGRAKFQNKDYVVLAVPTRLVVALPFDLKVEPISLKLAPGSQDKMKVTAVRKGGYQGPIAVEVRNLPAGVTAPKATIAMGQTAVDVEVMAAANAAVGDKADVNVVGTAVAAGNQQNASSNFTVSITKK